MGSAAQFPVDVVYTWVDGNDPSWQAKKIAALNELSATGAPTPHINAVSNCRFMGNDELRYSLRSLELYAPWIRKIFLVTDGQYPQWLDLSRVQLVTHRDIFPEYAALPTFSNRPIELCLHRIEGLAEHYLYFNDDFMLGKHIRLDDFFTPSGQPLTWMITKNKKYSQKILSCDSKQLTPHRAGEVNAYRMILERYSRIYSYRIRHYPRPMTRSILEKIWIEFSKDAYRTLSTRFRSNNDLPIYALYPLFAIATGQGKPRAINGMRYIGDLLQGRVRNISTCLGDIDYKNKIKRILRLRPLTFCLNDCESASQENRDIMRKLLDTLFPHKSSFEK